MEIKFSPSIKIYLNVVLQIYNTIVSDPFVCIPLSFPPPIILYKTVFRIRIRIGSGFRGHSESGSGSRGLKKGEKCQIITLQHSGFQWTSFDEKILCYN